MLPAARRRIVALRKRGLRVRNLRVHERSPVRQSVWRGRVLRGYLGIDRIMQLRRRNNVLRQTGVRYVAEGVIGVDTARDCGVC